MQRHDCVSRIVTILIVWLVAYVCSQIMLTALPLNHDQPFLVLFGHETNIDSLTFFIRLAISIPNIALMGVLIADMARRHTFDIADLFALVVTFFIGLPGALIYTLIPQRHVLYGGILSIYPVFNMLSVFRALPPVLTAYTSKYSTAVIILVNIVIMVVLASETRRNEPALAKHLPLLMLTGLYFPACSVLLRFALNTPETDIRSMRRYTVPFLVLSLLYVVDTIALTFLPLDIQTDFNFINIHSSTMAIIIAGTSIYVFFAMLCDRRVREVRWYGWLAVGSLVAPSILFSVARLCPTRDSESITQTI